MRKGFAAENAAAHEAWSGRSAPQTKTAKREPERPKAESQRARTEPQAKEEEKPQPKSFKSIWKGKKKGKSS